MDDPYRTLNLPPGTPWPDVEATFRRLASIHHPNNGGDQQQFARLLAAYEQIRTNAPPVNRYNAPPPEAKSGAPSSKVAVGRKREPNLNQRIGASVAVGAVFLAVTYVALRTLDSWKVGVAVLVAAGMFFAFPTVVISLFQPYQRIVVFAAGAALLLSFLLPATFLLVAIMAYFVVNTLKEFPLSR